MDYEKQAHDFLKQTQTKFEAEYVRTGLYFPDDKDRRDIYSITLTKGGRSYTFNFGQSIRNSGEWQMDITANGYVKGQPLTDEERRKARGVFFSGGWGKWCSRNPHYEAPTPYHVLACVTKYDPGTFEDFCLEYGYDIDSRKAEGLYKACKQEYTQLCTLYSEAEIQALCEIS